MNRGGGIRNKHRNGCAACLCISASSPAFGFVTHPISGRGVPLCFRHVVNFCRTPKHAEVDGQPYKTGGSWYLIKAGNRKRWMPTRGELFELKSNGWTTRREDNGQNKWHWIGAEVLHENWSLIKGTHGKVYAAPKIRTEELNEEQKIEKWKSEGQPLWVKCECGGKDCKNQIKVTYPI